MRRTCLWRRTELSIVEITALFLLGSCTRSTDWTLSNDNLTAPKPQNVVATLRRVAIEARLSEPVEVAGPIPANVMSSAPWIVCLRSGATAETKRFPYSVFFKDEQYVFSRSSVILDNCETQQFVPLQK